jgi:hypothetical protein
MKTTMQENRKRTIGSTGKKLFIVLFSLGLAVGASAQRGSHGGYAGGGFHGGYYGHAYYPRTYVGVGLGYGWGLGYGLGWGFGYGYPGWYGPWYAPYPPYYYGRGPMPSQLNEQIDGIKSDYKAQIKDVKHDKTLPKSERNVRVNQLEQQRDAAITQARHDYYNRSRQNNNGQPQRNNGNGSSPNDPEHPEYSQKSAATGGQQ